MGEPWQTRAACRDHNPELFFPDPSDTVGINIAARICHGCPVTAECMDGANRRGEKHGVWAGFGRTERGVPARPRGRPSEPRRDDCGTPRGVRAHRDRGERLCRSCWAATDVEYRRKYAKSLARSERR